MTEVSTDNGLTSAQRRAIEVVFRQYAEVEAVVFDSDVHDRSPGGTAWMASHYLEWTRGRDAASPGRPTAGTTARLGWGIRQRAERM